MDEENNTKDFRITRYQRIIILKKKKSEIIGINFVFLLNTGHTYILRLIVRLFRCFTYNIEPQVFYVLMVRFNFFLSCNSSNFNSSSLPLVFLLCLSKIKVHYFQQNIS